MSRIGAFDEVLAALHEAAFDDARWPKASALIDEACGIKGNMLVYGSGTSHDNVVIYLARLCYRGARNEALERRYFEEYYPQDERVPRFRALPDSRLVHVSELYTDEEKKTSAAYNEALPLSDTQNCLSVRMDGPNGSRIVWSFADPVEADGWSFAQTETIERLLPHLRQYVRMRQVLADAGGLRASLAALLDLQRHRRDPAEPAGADRGGERPRRGHPQGAWRAVQPERFPVRRGAGGQRPAPGTAGARPAAVGRPGRCRLHGGDGPARWIALRAARHTGRPGRGRRPALGGGGAGAGGRPVRSAPGRPRAGRGGARPVAGGEPGRGVAGRGQDRARGRNGERTQRGHHPLAHQADLREAGDRPARPAGVAGAIAGQAFGRRVVSGLRERTRA